MLQARAAAKTLEEAGKVAQPDKVLSSGRTTPPGRVVQLGRTTPLDRVVQLGRTTPPGKILPLDVNLTDEATAQCCR